MHYPNFQSFCSWLSIPASPPKYTKDFLENTKENWDKQVFQVLVHNKISIDNLPFFVAFLGPSGSFDTHIVIYMTDICYTPYMTYMS